MSYAGAIATGVGGELQGTANYWDKMEQYQTYLNELKRQGVWQGQATDALNQRIGTADAGTAQKEIGQGAANRVAAYNAAGATPLAIPTATTMSTSMGADKAYAGLMGQNRAALGGYSDWGLQQAINNINAQRTLRAIEDTAGGYARNVYPYSLYEAQHKWDMLAAAGQFLQMAAPAASMAGAAATQGGQQQVPTYMNQVGDYGQGFGTTQYQNYALGTPYYYGGSPYA